MEQHLYTIELKCAAITRFDYDLQSSSSYTAYLSPSATLFRIGAGIVYSSSPGSIKFTRGEAVLFYVPHTFPTAFREEMKRIGGKAYMVDIDEDYILPKPPEISYEQTVAAIDSCLKSLTGIHYNLNLLKDDSLLVVGSIEAYNIAKNRCDKIFLAGADSQGTIDMQDVISKVLQETAGLGVHSILDYSNSHTPTMKHAMINCLRLNGKWCVTNPYLQLDPPESTLLFMRNASLSFLNHEIWVEAGFEHGKFVHLMMMALKMIKEGEFEQRISKIGSLGNIEEALENVNEHGTVILKP
jgi:NADPH:quinone reductase-like Zn-dependent oxidoreductase